MGGTRTDGTLELADGRLLAYADYGPPEATPVLWCHGGPGSRLEPLANAVEAAHNGFRIIGIDRPGYGGSSPVPGRSIASWVLDAMVLADHLALERFVAVGVSTGGAYALALAALEPGRVGGCVVCCGLTDMRWADGRAMMTGPSAMGALISGIWSAPDRSVAVERTTKVLGIDGSGLLRQTPEAPFPPADVAFLTDPARVADYAESMAEMFRFGVEGFTDDRLADGVGWNSFDVTRIECPTVVLHGSADPLVPPAQAVHTASLVPNATLRVVPELGHFSISGEIVPVLREFFG